jgi:hypothetical protein
VIPLDGYTADYRVFGLVELGEVRLTDWLNQASELRLIEARLEGLVDGDVIESAELTIAVDDLLAAVVAGPRGDPARRLHTQTIKVVVELGPYEVIGSIHGTPAANPLAALYRRGRWVPLTDATISYRRGPNAIVDALDGLLVNRDWATSFRAVAETPIASLPWERRPEDRPLEP